MTHKSDYWDRGIGSPGIVIINMYTKLAIGSDKRKALEALDQAIRDVAAIPGMGEILHRVGVALVNTRLGETGQLFSVGGDGKVVESIIVVPELRDLVATLMSG